MIWHGFCDGIHTCPNQHLLPGGAGLMVKKMISKEQKQIIAILRRHLIIAFVAVAVIVLILIGALQ